MEVEHMGTTKDENMIIINKQGTGIGDNELYGSLSRFLSSHKGRLRKVLLLPPDHTRIHSGAGKITAYIYSQLKGSCEVDIMPALGTHAPMGDKELAFMFGPDIPSSQFIVHNWRSETVDIGEVPGSFVSEVSEGLVDYPIRVSINRRLLNPEYDLILSIGQVVPHEVVGMANYNKNIFVGCGGTDMINKSHMLGAVYGMERMMGRADTPVRRVFDFAEKEYLQGIPLVYILTVASQREGKTCIHGLFAGKGRRLFDEAAALSQEINITFVDKPITKVVVYLDPKEFRSTWLGNKAIYRTRMAIADGGELVILAPGVGRFGEDEAIDRLIRRYGYAGRDRILRFYKENRDLRENLSAAAHLIHGSSDGRFTICYAPGGLSREEMEGVHFKYISYEDATARYNPSSLRDGYNTLEDNEIIYYISNPSIGLWALKEKFT
jgi:nickel-dependent lactate racemase